MTKLARVLFAAVVFAAVTTAMILATLTWMDHPARRAPAAATADLAEGDPAPEESVTLTPVSAVTPR